MICGPAGTGKTFLIAWGLHICNKMHPRTVQLWARATRKSLNESVLEVFEGQVLAMEAEAMGLTVHPMLERKVQRSSRDEYQYPNGSRIVLGTMEFETRIYSTQYHVAWINELFELGVESWESLHRAVRRHELMGQKMGGPGFDLLLGDTNPREKHHWAKRRADKGRLHHILSRFEDNPMVTKRYLQRLENNLTGHRLQRLRYGRWTSASGLVYDAWDEARHMETATVSWIPDGKYRTIYLDVAHGHGESAWTERVSIKWTLGGLDWGYNAPGSFQVWGVDEEGGLWLLYEVYHRAQPLAWWADRVAEAFDRFAMRLVTADSAEPRSIDTLNTLVSGAEEVARRNHLEMPQLVQKAEKDWERTSQLMRAYLENDRFHVLRGVQEHIDRELDDVGKPTCLAQEIESLIWIEYDEDAKPPRNLEQVDPKCEDHATDAARYVCAAAWRQDLTPAPPEPKDIEGTVGELVGHEELMRKSRQNGEVVLADRNELPRRSWKEVRNARRRKHRR